MKTLTEAVWLTFDGMLAPQIGSFAFCQPIKREDLF
jgi:hypothetical protein